MAAGEGGPAGGGARRTQESAEARFNRARRDARAAVPVQTSPRRVHAMLRSRIQAGELRADDVLVEEDVVRTYATSRNAVREALSMLAADGLVLRSPRVGTMVVSGVTQLTVEGLHAPLQEEEWRTTTELVEAAVVPSSPLLRAQLATDDPELSLHESLVRIDGEPYCVYTSYHATTAAPLPLDFDTPGWSLAWAFQTSRGVPLEVVETTVQAMACEPRTARRLGVNPGAPVLVRSRLLMDATERHREFSYTYWVDGRVALGSRTRLSELAAGEPATGRG